MAIPAMAAPAAAPAAAQLGQNMAAGAGISPTSGDGNHPPSWPSRGWGGLAGGPFKLGQSGPFSGMKFKDLNDRNLYDAMKAINPNNPGALPAYDPQAEKQRQTAYNKMKHMYDQRRDRGIRELARAQYPAASDPDAPPLDQEIPHAPDELWNWSELDDYNLSYKNEEFINFPNAPDKVAFPGSFSHPENAVAYFTDGYQSPPEAREMSLDGTPSYPGTDYQNDVLGQYSYTNVNDEPFEWEPNFPADNPEASLWVQGNSGPAALQQNADIANQHYNYIYTDNEWGY